MSQGTASETPGSRASSTWHTGVDEATGRQPGVGPHAQPAVSFGSFLTAQEHDSPHRTRARLTVRHTMENTDTASCRSLKETGHEATILGRFWFGKA